MPIGEFLDICNDCYWYTKLNRTKRKPSKQDDLVVFVNGHPLKRCSRCRKYKDAEAFPADKKAVMGIGGKCKSCYSEIYHRKYKHTRKEATRIYYRKNKERLDAYNAEWRRENRDKYLLSKKTRQARRRTLKQKLPETMSVNDHFLVCRKFGNKCPLTESRDIQLDHFIPLSWGVGGTDKSNIIPLNKNLNFSKSDRNPLEWAEEMISSGEFSKERWEEVVEYLAHLNGLSVDEYRDFVYMCEYFKEGNG